MFSELLQSLLDLGVTELYCVYRPGGGDYLVARADEVGITLDDELMWRLFEAFDQLREHDDESFWWQLGIPKTVLRMWNEGDDEESITVID